MRPSVPIPVPYSDIPGGKELHDCFHLPDCPYLFTGKGWMEVTSGFTGSLCLAASSSPLIPASSPSGNLCCDLSALELEPHQVAHNVIQRLAFRGVEAPPRRRSAVESHVFLLCSGDRNKRSASAGFPPRPYRGGHFPPPFSGAQLWRCSRASAEQEAVHEGGQAGPRGLVFL